MSKLHKLVRIRFVCDVMEWAREWRGIREWRVSVGSAYGAEKVDCRREEERKKYILFYLSSFTFAANIITTEREREKEKKCICEKVEVRRRHRGEANKKIKEGGMKERKKEGLSWGMEENNTKEKMK